MPRMLMIVEMRPIDREHEPEFNRWYAHEHIPEMLDTPGIIAASRYELANPALPGHTDGPGQYMTIWEMEANNPQDAQEALNNAMGSGRWSMHEFIDYASMSIRFFKPLSEHITK